MVLAVVSGCTVSPPPAPQSTDTTESTPPPPVKVTQIIMGIDSIGPGFNSTIDRMQRQRSCPRP